MSQTITTGELLELPLAQLRPASDNPRRDVGDVTELAESIKSGGLHQPILAVKNGKGYVIVAGHRRHAAAKLAGLETIPVIVRVMTDAERVAAMLVENLQRSDLSPLEEATGLNRLVEEFGVTQRELVPKVGRSQSHISKRLQLLELPENVREALDSGGITIGDALLFLQLKNMPKRLANAFAQVTKQNWGVDQAVSRELRDHEVEQKVAKATEEMNTAGIKIVKHLDRYGYPELPTTVRKLGGAYYGSIAISPAAHKAHPCHAAAIDPRSGEITWLCTNPKAHEKGAKVDANVAADEKAARAKEREAERNKMLRAREKNIELGALLEARLAAPAIDAENMRLLADLLVMHDGDGIAQSGLRFTDDDSQTVVEKKDGSISRIVHVDHGRAKELLVDRLTEARTAEEIMGVLLQAMIAARYADKNAVSQSQRWGSAHGISGGYGTYPTRDVVERLAAKHGLVAKKPKAKVA